MAVSIRRRGGFLLVLHSVSSVLLLLLMVISGVIGDTGNTADGKNNRPNNNKSVDKNASAAIVLEKQAEGRKLFGDFDILAYKENMLHKKISYLFSMIPRPNAGYYPPYYSPVVQQHPPPVNVIGGYPAVGGYPAYPAAAVPSYYPNKPGIVGAYPSPGYYPAGAYQPGGGLAVYPGRPPIYLPVEAESQQGTPPGGTQASSSGTNNNNRPVCNNSCGASLAPSSGGGMEQPQLAVAASSESSSSSASSQQSAAEEEIPGGGEAQDKNTKPLTVPNKVVIKMMPKSFKLN